MELWNYIEILRNKKQWFFSNDNSDVRLNALTKILELGYPSIIPNLFPFLKDKNLEIRNANCKVIIQLFKKIETKKGYYDILKQCDISINDIDFYEKSFSKDEFLTILAIASLNRSGYVREKAVKKLTETNNERAIQFIIYRLADWVQTVRDCALIGVQNFKKAEYINSLIDNLPLFEWLQKVERTNLSAIHADLMNFIVVQNKKYVVDNFTTFADKGRLIIAKQISITEDVDLQDLKLLLQDKLFLIRDFALTNFNKLTQTEIDNLLKDKSAKVRLHTLHNLQNQENFSKIIYPFLADNSVSIREFARYTLKNEISDFPSIYNSNLLENIKIIGSLCGLGETNGKQFIGTIEKYLMDRKSKVIKAAFLALKKLDTDKTYNFAYKNLGCGYIGIRNLVIEFLSVSATPEVLQKARDFYKNGDIDLKKSMLKLFSKIGKYSTIADLMLGTIDENENIRDLSVDYLSLWKINSARYFMQPSNADIERANQIFRYAFEMHEDKKYFNQNPLTGIDFYLR